MRSLYKIAVLQNLLIFLLMVIHSISAFLRGGGVLHSGPVNLSRTLPQRRIVVRHMAKKKESAVRPSIDDVERISRGQAAKKRGVGSRAVPHRLNAAERKEWDLAKKRRFVQLRGTGWRRQRGDSPLANIYRNYCDAVAIPCISIQRSLGQAAIADTSEPQESRNVDFVVIDFSPLRRLDVSDLAAFCVAEAKEKFPRSIASIDDASDYSIQGWDGLEDSFRTDAIWRIPSCSITVGFNVRADSKRFAEGIAVKFAGGQPLAAGSNTSGGGAGRGGRGGGGNDIGDTALISSGDDPFRPEESADADEDDWEDELEELEDEEDDDE